MLIHPSNAEIQGNLERRNQISDLNPTTIGLFDEACPSSARICEHLTKNDKIFSFNNARISLRSTRLSRRTRAETLATQAKYHRLLDKTSPNAINTTPLVFTSSSPTNI